MIRASGFFSSTKSQMECFTGPAHFRMWERTTMVAQSGCIRSSLKDSGRVHTFEHCEVGLDAPIDASLSVVLQHRNSGLLTPATPHQHTGSAASGSATPRQTLNYFSSSSMFMAARETDPYRSRETMGWNSNTCSSVTASCGVTTLSRAQSKACELGGCIRHGTDRCNSAQVNKICESKRDDHGPMRATCKQ